MTGKYTSWETDSFNDDFLKAIANELAEANRLERYKINFGAYQAQPITPVEDEA
mgnify:CR=1 FL=1